MVAPILPYRSIQEARDQNKKNISTKIDMDSLADTVDSYESAVDSYSNSIDSLKNTVDRWLVELMSSVNPKFPLFLDQLKKDLNNDLSSLYYTVSLDDVFELFESLISSDNSLELSVSSLNCDFLIFIESDKIVVKNDWLCLIYNIDGEIVYEENAQLVLSVMGMDAFGILEHIYLNIDDFPDAIRKKFYLKKKRKIRQEKIGEFVKSIFS